MTKTKRAFILAGSIVGIVEASSLMFLGLMCFLIVGLMGGIDPSLLIEDATITIAEAEQLVKLIQMIYGILGAVITILGPIILTASIVTLKQKNKPVAQKGPIITLLVLSALICNIITVGFMIACLCIKDKTPNELVTDAMNNK